MIYNSYSAQETEAIACEIAKPLRGGEIITLDGDLGAGKTAFVRGMAEGLMISDSISSPTFTIVNEYNGGKIPFYHFDVYRINDDDELYAMGFDDYVQKGICVVEWSENIPDSIPNDAYKITIERVCDNENARKITIEKSED